MPLVSALAASLILQQGSHVVDHGTEWIGKPAKSVVVKDENGADVDLSKKFGKKPVVLVFYRAIW